MLSFNALNGSLATLCVIAALSPIPARAITWIGGGGNALASNGHNWEGAVAPGAGDPVLLNASSSSNMIWDLDVAVGSWTQDGYTGTVTLATRFASGFTNLVITGNCHILSGTWTHLDNSSDETYRLRVTVGGDMTVGAEARISTTGRGYDVGRGPGSPTSAHGGAGHGGEGDRSTFPGSAPCYGSVCSPVNLGSGGKGYDQCGGGAILINVAGTLTANGNIDADGTKYVGGTIKAYYGSSGGSVWLTAASLAGTGSVSAAGSYVSTGYFGAGGRIALVQTGPATDFSGFRGSVRAVGSWSGTAQYGAAGTIYYETAADGRGGGILVVDGNGTGTGEAFKTRILLDEQDAGFSPKSYVLKNNAYVEFSGSDAVFHPGDTLVTTNKTRIYVRSGTTIDLRGTTFIGGGTIDRQIRMYAGSAMRVDDDFTFNDITVYATDDNIAAAQYTNLTVTSSSVTLGAGAILVADYPVIFAGNLRIGAGGTARHSANSYDEKYKLNLAVRGNMTIETGGSVNVDGLGYRLQNGPGAVSSPNYYGACHGGRGVYYSNGTMLTAAACYGSIRRPSTMGSGGVNSQSGGGVIRLSVDGTLLNNGAISACGNKNSGNQWSAAGGSIWITTREIVGAGDIYANGTPGVIPASTQYELSGGGRVAVDLTDAAADFGDYAGVICARGNQRTGQQIYGGAGTVYLKTGAQAFNGGTLIIDNFTASSAATCGTTDIAPLVTDTDVGSVVIRNGGHLSIFSGRTLSVSGEWSVTNNATFTSAADGVVRFTGNGVSRVTGDTTFGTFDCRAAGKELAFAAGGAFAIAAGGMLRIDSGAGAPVVLSSQTNGVRWTLDVDATASVLVNNAEVSDADASVGAVVVAANTTLDNCVNWSTATVAPGELITWTGVAGTSSFAMPGNWTPSRMPVTTDKILVSGTAPIMPILAFDLVCAELTVAGGASLGLGGHAVTVNGPLTVAGTLTARSGETITVHGNCSFAGGVLDTHGTSTLVLAGGTAPGAQVFTPDGLAFDTIICTPGASGISITGSFSAAYLSCSSASDTRLAFAAGATATVTGGLLLDGTAATPCITLASATGGSRWNLAVTGHADISGVIVGDSAATASALFAADSTDGGNNTRWVFDTDQRVTWVGGGSGDFGQAANWSGNGVPGSGDAVFIADALVTAAATVSIRAMTFGPGAVFTANAPVNVADAVVLTGNASVAFNRKTEIGGSLILNDDAVLTHSPNSTTQANVLDVHVGGDLIIGSSAAVDTRAKGFVGSGPGRAGNCGGSHGGRGETHQAGANANRVYGSIYCPTNIGSAGSENAHSGGGAVRLAVAGAARIDGKINAEGCPSGSYTYYSGSGGSVWLAAERLLGGGEISANGGDCYNDYIGGGGRVAVHLTADGAAFDAFTGVVSAYSGRQTSNTTRPRRGSCGTVYLETAGDGTGRGRIILDNTDTGIARGAPGQPRTDYPVVQYADPQDGRHAVWTLRNTVRLNLVGDARLADLVMEGPKPILELNGYTLRVDARKHALGDNESVQVVPGDGGLILWAPATLLIVR